MSEDIFHEMTPRQKIVLLVLYRHRPAEIPMAQLISEVGELIDEHGSIDQAIEWLLSTVQIGHA